MNIKLTNGLLGLGALLIAGQVSAATVSLTPSASTVNIGDALTLTVQGSDFFDDVSAGSVTVTWDPAAMTMTSTLADITTSALLNGFPIDFGVNTLVPGQLEATYSTFGTVFGPTFDFFSMDFIALGSSTVNIAAGPGGDWQDGNTPLASPVIIDSYVGASVSAVPVPAAVWLFGSGLIGMVGIARRRKTQLA